MRERGLPVGVVLTRAGYGADTGFREGLQELGLRYVVGVPGTVSVWRPVEAPLPPKRRSRYGRPPRLLRRSPDHRPVSVRQLAMELGEMAFRPVSWREGTSGSSPSNRKHEAVVL